MLIAATTLYCTVFLVQPPATLPAEFRRTIRAPAIYLRQQISNGLAEFYGRTLPPEVTFGVYLLVTAGFIPWLAAAGLGLRRPAMIGMRIPNRYALRILPVAYLLALPFLVWMVRSPTIGSPYLNQLHRLGATVYLAYYLVNMLTEHFLLHGVVLGVCHRDGRWPMVTDNASALAGRPRGFLAWLGLAQPTGDARGLERFRRWFGLPHGCTAAILTSGVLFGLVHLSKDPRELLLAFPGGVAQAFLAYRTNSWLTPFALHLTTAATALGMMLLAS